MLDRSTKDIAETYGCKQNTIQSWLLKHKIKKEIKHRNVQRNNLYQNFDYLFDRYVRKNMSISDIAKEVHVHPSTIEYNMKRCGIPTRKITYKKFSKYQEDDICELYSIVKLSAFNIGKMYNTDHNTIIRVLQRNGVQTRGLSESHLINNSSFNPQLFCDKQFLYESYWVKNMTCKEIGNVVGVNSSTISRQLRRLGIAVKSDSESKVGRMIGEKHPNWQGGRTPLNALLREYFTINISKRIANRDEFTCQMCGKTHTILHIHHITPFKEIVDTIIGEHPDLSVEKNEDRGLLYDIIVRDVRFLDENNLITLCKECHKKIHSKKTSSQASVSEEGSETIENPRDE